MGARIAGFLFCMVFAVPFGGVGLLAALGVGKTFLDSHRANDWVLVQAKVDEAALNLSRGSKGGTTYSASAAYRYTIGGKEYVGTRLGFDPWGGGSDNIGDWQEEMAAFMEDARKTGRSVPVYVNPDHPEDAVVDREVRWPMVSVMGMFALTFGGVGLGALVGGGFILLGGKSKKARADRKAVEAYVAKHNRASVGGGASSVLEDSGAGANEAQIEGAGSGSAIVIWIVALVWNGFSWPMAYVVGSQILASREWLGLFVFLFPFIGLFIFWGAIKYTFALARRGRATLRLDTLDPYMGGRLAGAVTFPTSGTPGEMFAIELSAYDARARRANANTPPLWTGSRQVRLAAHPQGGSRVPFQVDIPARVARSDGALEWKLAIKVAGETTNAVDTFSILVGPPRGDVSALPEPEPSPDVARNAQAMAKLFGAELAAKMPPQQQAALAQLPPGTQHTIAEVVKYRATIKYVVIGIAVLLLASQLIGALVAFVR
ncbi:hypothetical protein BWI17_00965 [Betaproteobacteria bacterium GR16-43]|nr:hypothetical protein BWI17_00965 [Betaproteobacteria bacterium GR16-43]